MEEHCSSANFFQESSKVNESSLHEIWNADTAFLLRAAELLKVTVWQHFQFFIELKFKRIWGQFLTDMLLCKEKLCFLFDCCLFVDVFVCWCVCLFVDVFVCLFECLFACLIVGGVFVFGCYCCYMCQTVIDWKSRFQVIKLCTTVWKNHLFHFYELLTV